MKNHVISQVHLDFRRIITILITSSAVLGWILLGAVIYDEGAFYDAHLMNVVAGLYDSTLVRILLATVSSIVIVLTLCVIKAVTDYQRTKKREPKLSLTRNSQYL